MSEADAPKHGLMNIGEEALPLFAVLPEPSSLFATRAKRFQAVAAGNPLAAYLTFLSGLSQAQNDIQNGLSPATLPDEEDIAQALENGMPPLPAAGLALDDVASLTFHSLLQRVAELPVPPATKTAIEKLLNSSPEVRRSVLSEALTTDPTQDKLAERVLALAGLQVHFARLASLLNERRLKRITDGVCPACGSLPVASSVVGWPKSHGLRFCTCSLCSTMWHVVRVKCVLCSSTEGTTYRHIEGTPDTIKAEACSSCQRYVKVLYQVNDHSLDPVADDVASLGLDMLMADEGWQRGSSNPFLLGY